jgi:hypothetical protein
MHGLLQFGATLGPEEPLELPPLVAAAPDEGSAEEITGVTASRLRAIPKNNHNHFVLTVTVTVSDFFGLDDTWVTAKIKIAFSFISF